MKTVFILSFLFSLLCFVPFDQTSAQDEDLYKDGTVWSLTFVRTGANKSDDYLVNAEKTDNKLLEKDLQNEKQLINCKGDKKQ